MLVVGFVVVVMFIISLAVIVAVFIVFYFLQYLRTFLLRIVIFTNHPIEGKRILFPNIFLLRAVNFQSLYQKLMIFILLLQAIYLLLVRNIFLLNFIQRRLQFFNLFILFYNFRLVLLQTMLHSIALLIRLRFDALILIQDFD